MIWWLVGLLSVALLVSLTGWWLTCRRLKGLKRDLTKAVKDRDHWESMVEWQLWFGFYYR